MVVVRPVGDEQDVLLAEAPQGEVVVGGLAGVDDVQPGVLVLSLQVVQVDVSLHHHLGHVVQLHCNLGGNNNYRLNLYVAFTEVS